MQSPFEAFVADDRAIEGLPIRLVIALVVGVTTLGVMMNMVSGINGLAMTEVDAKPAPEVVTPGDQQIDVAVVGAEGESVTGATVVVKRGTADIDGVHTATTNENGVGTVTLTPSLGPNQNSGTLQIEIKPPASSQYVDRRENTKILVVAE